MAQQYVQFGCGLCAPAGWRNFDAGPAFWLQKRLPWTRGFLIKRGFPDYPVKFIEYADVIKGLPVAAGSAAGVYSSHVLEHLSLEGFRATLRNVYNYLAPVGCFRFVLPDLEYMIRRYVEEPGPEAAMKFIEASGMGERHISRGSQSMLRLFFGRSKHLWLWDYKAMESELKAAGYSAIRRAQFGDSEDARFNEVEDRGRWENCLGVECKRLD